MTVDHCTIMLHFVSKRHFSDGLLKLKVQSKTCSIVMVNKPMKSHSYLKPSPIWLETFCTYPACYNDTAHKLCPLQFRAWYEQLPHFIIKETEHNTPNFLRGQINDVRYTRKAIYSKFKLILLVTRLISVLFT